MNIPNLKPRKRIAWQVKREIAFGFRIGDNRKARSAIYINTKPVIGLHPDTQDVAYNLHDCGLDRSVIPTLLRRYGIIDMILNDPYILPAMSDVIEYGVYRSCRIRYSKQHNAIIQEHEILLEGDHWILYYSPHGYWVVDCLPF